MDICRGSVYFIQHREVTSPKPHFLIVLNNDIENDEYIMFGVVTSKVKEAKARILSNHELPETLVEISPADYPELDMDSAVDCNSPVKWNQFELKSNLRQIKPYQKADLNPDICEKIVDGVMKSKAVSPKLKNCLRKKEKGSPDHA